MVQVKEIAKKATPKLSDTEKMILMSIIEDLELLKNQHDKYKGMDILFL